MAQETIAKILEIEKSAVKIHNEAHQRAVQVVAEAEKTMSFSRKNALEQAQQEVAQIVAEARQAAKATYDQIIATTREDIAHLESQAEQNFDRALTFVVERVAGRG